MLNLVVSGLKAGEIKELFMKHKEMLKSLSTIKS